jgi:hypothetical protein
MQASSVIEKLRSQTLSQQAFFICVIIFVFSSFATSHVPQLCCVAILGYEASVLIEVFLRQSHTALRDFLSIYLVSYCNHYNLNTSQFPP